MRWYHNSSPFSPSVVLDVKTKSDENSGDIQASIDRAVSEAISDGTIGNLESKQDSVSVEAPKGTWKFSLTFRNNVISL